MAERLRENKKIWLAIAAVEILVICLAGFFYSRRKPVEIAFTQNDLVYDSGEPGFYLDTTTSSSLISTPAFTLPKGMYTVTLQYEYEGLAIMNISYVDGRMVSNVSGNIQAGNTGISTCDFKVRYNNRPVQVNGRLRGDAQEGSYLLIREIKITDSPVALANFLFRIVMAFLLLNLLLVFALYWSRLTQNKVKWRETKQLALLILFGSIPLFIDYLPDGAHDISFHLMRIEGIREGLQSGMFPVRIQPGWLNGHGYAVSIFYGDLFLYIPAILRMFGISIQTCYQFYVLLVNAATVLVSYFFFSRMSDRQTGMFCAALYSLNIYRLTCLYSRAAVGEYTAMIFLPMLLYGFWSVYTREEDSEEYKNSWIIIALGFTGLILTHMITCEMAALFIVILCAVLWKRTFRKKTFLTLVKAAVALCLLNLWFLVPFLDYMKNGVYVLNASDSYAAFRIDERAAFPAQLFMNTYDVRGMSTGHDAGIISEMPQTPGIALLLVLVSWFLLCTGEKNEGKEEKRRERLCVCLCALSLILTTYLVPFSELVEIIPLLKLPIRSIQYPWRFLSAAAVFLTWLACLMFGRKGGSENWRKLMKMGIFGIACWQALTFMSSVLRDNGALRIYQMGNMTTLEVSGGEYLPPGYNLNDYVDALTYDAEKVTVSEWGREKNQIHAEISNLTTETQQVEVPYVYYKGYVAEDENGNSLPILTGASGRISVSVPAGYTGSFKVEFREPWYWRVSEVISMLMLLVIVLSCTKWFEKKEKKILWRRS
ncbi:MAG TPA: hypothetical protein H9717_07140 [Candidatus Eisenbergiella merdipullorum]|uniref:Membrane protein 6-pyruvoyl-tetrahydropterin synthase-related domain-containing protein n=1 Tax=Candidatus Eisenbergiella merdipullorum TaxID=2838553 RepID=A0A9D2KZR0_9FIRM|nr:hypothetical protein [Candidatus Eisenbergiella merdipullorum]